MTPVTHNANTNLPLIIPPTEGIWQSRGYIPHFNSSTAIQHVTFHLADSLPSNVLARIEKELQHIPALQRDIERRKQAGDWIDAGHGCCILAKPDAARLVQNAFLHFDGVRYRLLAWVIMPNHVHTLFQPIHDWSLFKIVTSWKSYTGRRLMPLLPDSHQTETTQRVWHREYWDRFIRDQKHFHAVIDYIHNNPVKANLARTPEEFPWSSANPGNATLQRGP